MSVKIIAGYNDPEFDDHADKFYGNFCPDDWDYIVIGDEEYTVDCIAYKLAVMDYEKKQIGEEYWAVCYHS